MKIVHWLFYRVLRKFRHLYIIKCSISMLRGVLSNRYCRTILEYQSVEGKTFGPLCISISKLNQSRSEEIYPCSLYRERGSTILEMFIMPGLFKLLVIMDPESQPALLTKNCPMSYVLSNNLNEYVQKIGRLWRKILSWVNDNLLPRGTV